jgi:sulfhydrogenase subunit alpha
MLVCIKDGKVIDVKLKIFKPPRFFEAFLRGRKFTEAPDIHHAHLRYLPGRLQMSACHTLPQQPGYEGVDYRPGQRLPQR